MFKMGLNNPFGYLKHKLWPKEGLGVKLGIKLQIYSRPLKVRNCPCMQVACHIPLERY